MVLNVETLNGHRGASDSVRLEASKFQYFASPGGTGGGDRSISKNMTCSTNPLCFSIMDAISFVDLKEFV